MTIALTSGAAGASPAPKSRVIRCDLRAGDAPVRFAASATEKAVGDTLSLLTQAADELFSRATAPPAARDGSLQMLTDGPIKFDVEVNADSTRELANILLQQAAVKRQVGGSIKLLVSNSPGGLVHQGFHIIDMMENLEVPIDTMILGGQTASMAALIFLSGSPGRRFMSRNATLLVHRPSASGIGGTQQEISLAAQQIEQLRKRGDWLISRKTGLPITEVQRMTDVDTVIMPLQALKLGFTDWVLVGKGGEALNRDSIKGLSDVEIDQLDTTGDYSRLKTYRYDPMIPSQASLQALLGGRRMAVAPGEDELPMAAFAPPVNISRPAQPLATTRGRWEPVMASPGHASLPERFTVYA